MSDNDGSDKVIDFGKLVKKTTPESENSEAEDALQKARVRSREALMLDVKLKDGTIESFDYSLPKRVTYKPDGTLIIRIGKSKIEMGGSALEEMRQAVTEGRAKLIQVGTQAEEELKPENKAHVDWLKITEGEDD